MAANVVGFEDGTTDHWVEFWGNISESVTTKVAFSGSHALLLTTQGSTYSAVGVVDLTMPQPGDTVVFRVWSSGGPGDVRPFVQDKDFAEHMVGPVRALPSGTGWFTVTWTVPDVSVHAIGLQLTNPGSGQLEVAIDALTWPGA